MKTIYLHGNVQRTTSELSKVGPRPLALHSAVNISDSPKSTLVFLVQFAGDAVAGPLNKVFCLIYGHGYLE